MVQYRVFGDYDYRGLIVPYAGFLEFEDRVFRGVIIDAQTELFDSRHLTVKGKFKTKGEDVTLEFERVALHPAVIQPTLSDPMIFTVSKKNKDLIYGVYEGSFRFKEACSNMVVGIDSNGDKAPLFIEDTHVTGKVNLTLEQLTGQ